MRETPFLYKEGGYGGVSFMADGNNDRRAAAEAESPEQGGKDEKPKSTSATSGGRMSRAEAGRLGGLKTKERHGEDHFRRIGRSGGSKGGATTRDRYGVEHYKKIGSLGGKK